MSTSTLYIDNIYNKAGTTQVVDTVNRVADLTTLKLGGNVIAEHTGIEGAGTVNLQNVTFPAGNVINVESTWFNNQLTYGTADGSGHATITSSGFSVVPSLTYVDITSKQSNSKYYINFTGNMSTSADSALADWIGAFGFLVDPNGGTSWTNIGSGTNVGGTTNNVKYFLSRAGTSTSGNDSYWMMQLAGSYVYQSSVSSGNTLRFAIEYFHYDGGGHETLLINRTSYNNTGHYPYSGSTATTITVMEIAQ